MPPTHLQWYALVATIALVFYPYFGKATPTLVDKRFRFNNGNSTRPLSTPHILSGLIYLSGSFYALYHSQYDISILCFLTWFSSSIYHLTHESRFFNLDFTFAFAMALIFLWTMFLSAPEIYLWAFGIDSLSATSLLRTSSGCRPSEPHFLMGLSGIPLGIFLFVACGHPADIVPAKSVDGKLKDECLCRQDNPMYNKLHPIWHIVSGLAPVLCIHFYSSMCAASSPVMGIIDVNVLSMRVPTVPALSLAVSLGFNLLANVAGIMPLK